MRIRQNVICFVAMATICRTVSSLDLPHEDSARPKERRFIFLNQSPTVSINMCSIFCPLVCTSGYIKSPQGCFQCQCAFSITAKLSSTVAAAINGGIFLDKPCNPAVRHCRLQCTFGFLEGTNGCQHCACKLTGTNTVLPSPAVTTVTHTVNTTPASVLQGTTTLGVSSIRPTVKTAVNSQPTTIYTSKSSISSAGNYNDPCISSQKTCDKHCGGNYVQGPGGCQYCLCATSVPKEHRTTTMAPATGRFGTIPHYLDLTPTSEACIMAKVICNQKCDNGFISHPNDCLFCSCRNPDLVTAHDDPYGFYVIFPNPCVQNRTTCGIMCINGYVMGPRDCEFCSCRL